MKKIVEKALQGAVSLPGRYSKLIEEAIPGYRYASERRLRCPMS